MITAYFKDDKGQTLVIDAPTFPDAYQQAVDQDFYVFDYDFEEWGDETTIDWEIELDAWEAKYKPIKNHFAKPQGEFEDEFVEDKFETYGEELDFVRSVYDTDPKCVWTLVDGDDGNLYIVDGYHLVNRVNYFITALPFEGKFMEVPYCIFDEEQDDED